MSALHGVRVVELGGIGPGPFCGMLLADMGADVVIVDRRDPRSVEPRLDLLNRNKRSIILDLKRPAGRDALLEMITTADMLIDPFRPGVAERLGIGPEVCLQRNPALIYGRITGWGQDGPLAQTAGHDLNYIALTGVLDCIGGPDAPVPPLNLVGDYGGGALYLLAGLLAAFVRALRTGAGEVVDAAMCDGSASLMTGTYAYWQQGRWRAARSTNFVDGSAPDYAVYRCSDDRFIAVTPMEGRFYAELLRHLGLEEADLPSRHDPGARDALKARLAGIFATRTRDEWAILLEGTDSCFAPVLTIEEAPRHSHMVHRGSFLEVDGVVQPAPAPRFSRAVPKPMRVAPVPGGNTEECLREWGVSDAVRQRAVDS